MPIAGALALGIWVRPPVSRFMLILVAVELPGKEKTQRVERIKLHGHLKSYPPARIYGNWSIKSNIEIHFYIFCRFTNTLLRPDPRKILLGVGRPDPGR